MPNIITITFNPCIDKSTSVDALSPGKKLKCSSPEFEPGGGGINVARALKKLGKDVTAIYPSGGYSGKYLNVLLANEKITTITIDTQNQTRENMIVLDKSNNVQYRFGMPGPELLEVEWKDCLKIVEETEAEYIVGSGSLPPGVPENIFALISAIAKKKNRKLIVDTSGVALELAIKEGVYLAKPNIGELSKLAGKEELDAIEIEPVAKELIRNSSCKILVISMGIAGAILVTKEEVHKVTAPVVKTKSTVGAGDSMVAGIVKKLSEQKSLKEALQFGVACGTAATLNPGTQLCKNKDVENLFRIIKANF